MKRHLKLDLKALRTDLLTIAPLSLINLVNNREFCTFELSVYVIPVTTAYSGPPNRVLTSRPFV